MPTTAEIAARYAIDQDLALAKDLAHAAQWRIVQSATLADLQEAEAKLTDALALLQNVIERRKENGA